jgi:hypothetical protein
MPIFIAALIGGLVQAAGSLVGRVLLSLGLGYVVFSGVDVSITFARDFVVSKISASHAQTVAVASACKVGVCLSIIFSALTMRLVFGGMQSGGVLRKMVHKS